MQCFLISNYSVHFIDTIFEIMIKYFGCIIKEKQGGLPVMMFSAEIKKMDMNVISLADTILHSAAKGAFAACFLFDFKAIKR